MCVCVCVWVCVYELRIYTYTLELFEDSDVVAKHKVSLFHKGRFFAFGKRLRVHCTCVHRVRIILHVPTVCRFISYHMCPRSDHITCAHRMQVHIISHVPNVHIILHVPTYACWDACWDHIACARRIRIVALSLSLFLSFSRSLSLSLPSLSTLLCPRSFARSPSLSPVFPLPGERSLHRGIDSSGLCPSNYIISAANNYHKYGREGNRWSTTHCNKPHLFEGTGAR